MSEVTPNEKNSPSLPKASFEMFGRTVAHVYAPRKITLTNSLNEIFAFARKEGASDVHLSSQSVLFLRKFGQLTPESSEIFTAQHIYKLLTESLPQKIMETFDKNWDVEYVHTIYGHGRFRLTLTKHRNGLELTARLIPLEIPKFAATGMPTACAGLLKWTQGLILITGPAGCGKSTTLATLIEMINQRRSDHIITIEDPIELVFEPDRCQISQRQIHTHTLSQDSALRAALREDPDVIVVSEIRNIETLLLALSASETGHLVLGTMNTTNAVQTILRLVGVFPTEEQQMIRNSISESLRGVICQQLIPKKDNTGMVPAYEVLLNTPSIANHIRKGTFSQIENTIITSKGVGMVLMRNSLEDLVTDGMISKEEADSRTIESQ